MILMGYTLCILATVGFGLCSHVPDDFEKESGDKTPVNNNG